MARKAATRFTIHSAEADRLILSARVLPDGAVQLNPKSAPYLLDREDGRPQINEHHYSLHQSPQSPGNQWKDTQILSDGRKLTTPLFTFGIRDGLFTPLFSRASARMDLPYYSVTRRPRDSAVDLGSHDFTRTVLITTIVVSAAGLALPPRDRLGVFAADLGPYRITIIRDALYMPSTDDGSFHLSATGPQRVGDGPSTQWFQHSGLGADDTYRVHYVMKENARRYLLGRLDHHSAHSVPVEHMPKSQDEIA